MLVLQLGVVPPSELVRQQPWPSLLDGRARQQAVFAQQQAVAPEVAPIDMIGQKAKRGNNN